MRSFARKSSFQLFAQFFPHLGHGGLCLLILSQQFGGIAVGKSGANWLCWFGAVGDRVFFYVETDFGFGLGHRRRHKLANSIE